MAKYVVDSTDLTNVADAIRTKGGTSDALVFPAGFVSAVEAITTGGGIGLPDFTYSGVYSIVDDGGNNWRIRFLTSGTFISQQDVRLDVFLVGGGASGGTGTTGGGGGYTRTERGVYILADQECEIIIGAGGVSGGGGETSGFGYAAQGGYQGVGYNGGNGGSGGAGYAGGEGGVDGGNGSGSGPGMGQGTTTREFAEANGTLYSTGGAVNTYTVTPKYGEPNTGDGGDGENYNGGSGIVVIRNARE